MKTSLTAAIIFTLVGGGALAQAAPPAAAGEAARTAWTRQQASGVIDSLDRTLGGYVFPDKVGAARTVLRANRSHYLAIGDREALAERLTRDIGAALDDKHFYVRVAAAGPAQTRPDPAVTEAEDGYGIASVQRLPGNVGYIDIREFGSTPESARRMEAALDLLKDTQALVIDLRANRGGGGAAMAALMGRLASSPIPRSVLFWRQADGSFERMEPETATYPAAQIFGRPVFLLTANYTISAAEGFAYDMQAAGRAMVVGETTRGGANPMNRPPFDLGEGLITWVANGRSENPITRGSANGTGVKPDVPTAPEQALSVAYRRALDGIQANGASPRFGRELAAAKADPDAALARAFAATPG